MKPHDLPVTAHDARAFETQALTAAAPRILIVDDDPSTVQALGRMLDRVGELHFVCSDAEALRLTREQRPDLALASVAVILVTSHREPDYEVEALALMPREPVDVLVATLQLRDMDGFALARRLRADPALCHVSLLLGPHADWRDDAQAFGLGASDFMGRPFPPAVLQARVRNLLRQRHEAEAGERARRSAWQRLGEARVADLVAAAPDAWLAVDADTQIVLANTAAGWRLGVEPARLLGRALSELQAWDAWPGTAPTRSQGEGRNRLTALRLGAAGHA
ncbi:response regulator [Methyloversatilis sp.]|uniref:response regulator n=1 Tax=Methyloversatilis sp. TaxID=2569862 RepID=UPI003F7073E5